MAERVCGGQIRVFAGHAAISNKALPYFGWSSYVHRGSMNDAGMIIDYWNSLPARW